ncbi:MAG: hypothetical protein WA435_08145 [Gallionellaceae bacterium]
MSDLIGWIIVVELAILIFGIFSLKTEVTYNREVLGSLFRSIEKKLIDNNLDINQHAQHLEATLQSIEYNLSLLKEHGLPSNLIRW